MYRLLPKFRYLLIPLIKTFQPSEFVVLIYVPETTSHTVSVRAEKTGLAIDKKTASIIDIFLNV